MEENPYDAPPADLQKQPTKGMATIPAFVAVVVLAMVFAMLLSPGGDPFSIYLFWGPSIIFGMVCFALGRFSRGRRKPSATQI